MATTKRARVRRAVKLATGSDAWWRKVLRDKQTVGSLNGIAPIDRVDVVRNGVPAEAVGVIAGDMGIAKERVYATLGMPRATIERKTRERQRLSADEGDRVVGLARLIGQVSDIVRQSGEPRGFDAAHWVAAWLDRPLPALGGRRPGSLMDTAEGREIVTGLVAQIQSGAYA
jgi:putative toxin-antitoxin system antitoxin component (TIGR02293 family)